MQRIGGLFRWDVLASAAVDVPTSAERDRNPGFDDRFHRRDSRPPARLDGGCDSRATKETRATTVILATTIATTLRRDACAAGSAAMLRRNLLGVAVDTTACFPHRNGLNGHDSLE